LDVLNVVVMVMFLIVLAAYFHLAHNQSMFAFVEFEEVFVWVDDDVFYDDLNDENESEMN
jgi:L-alanine-DL-glutamate epimerase-like enolase superfamily enzyme